MIIDFSKVNIFVRPGITDMRKQINGLSVLAEAMCTHLMGKDSGSGSLFLFCSRNKKQLKCIYWDKNGFCMWLKKLEKDKFPWPMTEDEVEEINIDQLTLLLSRIDFRKAHKEIYYKEMN